MDFKVGDLVRIIQSPGVPEGVRVHGGFYPGATGVIRSVKSDSYWIKGYDKSRDREVIYTIPKKNVIRQTFQPQLL